MTDRELLELAAKAAGLRLVKFDAHVPSGGVWIIGRDRTDKLWNPLNDDGDALRLAVNLQIEPRFINNSHSNGAEPNRVALHNITGIVENGKGDMYAATRRVIVRAAAEIGRELSSNP